MELHGLVCLVDDSQGVQKVSFSQATYAHSPWPFVPADFEVPERLDCGHFVLRQLRLSDAEADYEAVMSSQQHLNQLWGKGWPEGLSLDQNRVDLGWREKEFQRRRSFAYTVVTPAGERVLGCVYIYPSRKRDYQAEVYLWARQSELASGLEEELFRATREWLEQSWPWRSVAFPGRTISDAAFLAMPNSPDLAGG